MLNSVMAVAKIKSLYLLPAHPTTGKPYLKMTATNIANNSRPEDESVEITVYRDFAGNLSDTLKEGDHILVIGTLRMQQIPKGGMIAIRADKVYRIELLSDV